MKKHQAEQYFQQLKKIHNEKSKEISMAQMVNILTGGAITVHNVQNFKDYVCSNEFNSYNFIQKYLNVQWTTLQFSQVYQIVKALKDYVNKDKKIVELPSFSDKSSQSSKVINNSKTTLQILEDIRESDATPVHSAKLSQYQDKWQQSKLKVIKKLLLVFDFFRKNIHDNHQSFDKNKQLCEKIDLTVFMKYLREFNMTGALGSQKAVRAFKNNSKNMIWMDFQGFVNAHMELIGVNQTKSSKDKYLRLRGLGDLLSSQKIKKMLNVRVKCIVANIVKDHTGTYKQDIINHLKDKQRQRQIRQKARWKGKRLKSEGAVKQRQSSTSSLRKNSSNRVKSQMGPSVYQQLQLPKLRVKQHRVQSIYKSLKQLKFSDQQSKIKHLIDVTDNQDYLRLYLKSQDVKQQKKKSVPKKKNIQLPRMKFT